MDLRRRLRRLEPKMLEAVERIAARGVALDGPELDAFEAEWARYCGAGSSVGVASGTDALRLTLTALGIGEGDEVIVPALTAMPTVAAVCAAGATPVPVDVRPDTGALDPDGSQRAVTARTRAAIVVHLYGLPATLPDLGVPVIEDAAHAHGALRGVSGVAAAYSFYPTKNLGAMGDGGAVVTDDSSLAERIRSLRSHGRNSEGLHTAISTNSRMSELTAAWLRAALPQLAGDNRRRAAIAAAYRQANPEIGWQDEHPDHVFHLCVARVENRTRLRSSLPFGTAVHYPRAVTDEPAYERFRRHETPVARDWAARCLSFPCYPELEDAELEQILRAIGEMR